MNSSALPALALTSETLLSNSKSHWTDTSNEARSETVTVPRHPLGLKPLGNRYTSHGNIKEWTGSFQILPDEQVIQILDYLDASSLVTIGATCKALYAFARFEDLWKNLFLE